MAKPIQKKELNAFEQLEQDPSKKHWFERKDVHLQNALKEALRIGDSEVAIECAKVLAQKGANLHWRGQEAPLVLALQRKDEKVLRWLIEQGVDIKDPVTALGDANLSKEGNYSYPLWIALAYKNAAGIKVLLKQNPDVSYPEDLSTSQFLHFGDGKTNAITYALFDAKTGKISDAAVSCTKVVLEHLKKTTSAREYKDACTQALPFLIDVKLKEYSMHPMMMLDAQWSARQLELLKELLEHADVNASYEALRYQYDRQQYGWSPSSAWEQMQKCTSIKWWAQMAQTSTRFADHVKGQSEDWFGCHVQYYIKTQVEYWLQLSEKSKVPVTLGEDKDIKALAQTVVQWLHLMPKERVQAFLTAQHFEPQKVASYMKGQSGPYFDPSKLVGAKKAPVGHIEVDGTMKPLYMQEDDSKAFKMPVPVYAKIVYECAKAFGMPYDKEQAAFIDAMSVSVVKQTVNGWYEQAQKDAYAAQVEKWSMMGKVQKVKEAPRVPKRV